MNIEHEVAAPREQGSNVCGKSAALVTIANRALLLPLRGYRGGGISVFAATVTVFISALLVGL